METLEIIITIFLAIVGSGSLIGIYVQYKIQQLQNEEQKLREERRKIYIELLEPFIELLSKKDFNEVVEKIKSPEYKKISFEFVLFGSDSVVRAHGDFMQHLYAGKDAHNLQEHSIKSIKLMTHLLIEIRKSLGNKNTKLTENDMLRHMITDMDKIKL